jgi:hypothetical protein
MLPESGIWRIGLNLFPFEICEAIEIQFLSSLPVNMCLQEEAQQDEQIRTGGSSSPVFLCAFIFTPAYEWRSGCDIPPAF